MKGDIMQRSILFVLIMISICLFLPLFFIGQSLAADYSEEITVYWDWEGPTPADSGLPSANAIADDLAWHLYSRKEGEQYGSTPAIAVPYGQNLELSGTINMQGQGTVRIYFVLRAFYDGGESGNSNEIYKDFIIPRDKPLQFRFMVEIQ